MEGFPFNMKVGEFNEAYDIAVNCRMVRPPHEAEGAYSSEFFLDRRLGLDPVYGADHSDEPSNVQNFLDAVDCNGRRYYLYRTDGRDYVGTFTDPIAKTGFTNVSGPGFLASTCNRMVKGRGVKGVQYNLNAGSPEPYTVLTPTAGTEGSKDFPSIPGYSGGYVKFKYDGSLPLSTGQFIVFRDGVLKGATLKIDLVEGVYPNQDVYVIGTNSRGSLPWAIGSNTGTGAQFDVFLEQGSTILVAHDGGVTMLVLDGANEARHVPIMTTEKPVVDIAKFNANIYALTEDRLHYSESIVNGDTNFYPLDSLPIENGTSLFPIGKAMIVFADSNMVIAPLVSADGTQKIVGYSLRYSGKPYSKYSAVFADKTIMVLQKDKQLMELDIVQNDSVSFDVVAKNVMEGNRGFFESLPEDGTVFATNSDKQINFTNVGASGSENYFFDKRVKEWFLNRYSRVVNKFIPEFSGVGLEPIGKDFIYSEGGDTDAGTTFEQSLSFSMLGWPSLHFVPWIRTQFGMSDVPIDVTFEAEFESGGKMDKVSKKLTGFQFDTRLSTSETGDELPGLGTVPKESDTYDGTMVSLQTGVMKTGRAIRFKYRSYKRFVIGSSYVFYAKSKNFINEPIGNS